MSRPLKDVLNSVLMRSSFGSITGSFFDTTKPELQQMVEFANEAADDIRDYAMWPMLRKTYIFTMTSSLEYDLPADFGYLVPESTWKYLGSRQVTLPTPDQLWGWFKAGNPGRGVTYFGKILNGKLHFQQSNAGDQVTLDYISRYAIEDSSGNPKERFDADDDVFLLDEKCLMYGTAAFWKGEKGLQTAQKDALMYDRSKKEALARDVGPNTIRVPDRRHYRGSSPLSSDYVWP